MNLRWRAIVDASPLSVLVVDREGTILDINRAYPPFLREDVLGQSAYLFVAPEQEDGMRARLEQVFATGTADAAEMMAADGRWLAVSCVPVVEEDGRVREVLLLCEDATAKKEQADALARRERLFRALVEKSDEGFSLVTADARVVYSSPSMQRMLGTELADVDPFSIVHPDDVAEARGSFARALATTASVRSRIRVIRGGDTRLLDVVFTNMIDDPDVAGIVCNFRDVTELESARHERDGFFELSADLLCVTSADGFFERVNPAWESTLGWTSEELMAQPFIELVHPDDRAEDNLESRYRCRDGSYRWLEWKSSCDPTTGLVYAIARDVTEKRRIDERLLHAQKMEAIGRLAGGVAHDINNMLAVIYSSTEALLATMPAADPARADIADIQHVAERSAALVRQLLAFGRKRPRSVRDVDIDGAVGGLAKMIARCVGRSFDVVVTSNARARVRIDPSELESIVMNLALNARDAMPDGGRIGITTESRHVNRARAAELGVEAGPYVALVVSDRGCGIPAELRHKVFEPFFTTKELGKGTGLGLATVFGIAQACGGAVEVESEDGAGTSFTVLLPTSQNTARRRTGSKPRAAVAVSVSLRAPSASPS
jgi:PAS domain S-box-containing protein